MPPRPSSATGYRSSGAGSRPIPIAQRPTVGYLPSPFYEDDLYASSPLSPHRRALSPGGRRPSTQPSAFAQPDLVLQRPSPRFNSPQVDRLDQAMRRMSMSGSPHESQRRPSDARAPMSPPSYERRGSITSPTQRAAFVHPEVISSPMMASASSSRGSSMSSGSRRAKFYIKVRRRAETFSRAQGDSDTEVESDYEPFSSTMRKVRSSADRRDARRAAARTSLARLRTTFRRRVLALANSRPTTRPSSPHPREAAPAAQRPTRPTGLVAERRNTSPVVPSSSVFAVDTRSLDSFTRLSSTTTRRRASAQEVCSSLWKS